MKQTPFSEYLTSMLSRRGAMAQLAAQSGVSHPQVSKMAAGDVIPSPDTLEKLIKPMCEADRAALVREYLLLHLPANAPMVRVIVNDEDSPRDRLQRAIDQLDPATRDSLAVLIEAVNRSPEQGARALQAVGLWFKSSTETPAVETPPNVVYLPQEGADAEGVPKAAEDPATYGGDGGSGDKVRKPLMEAAKAFLEDGPPEPLAAASRGGSRAAHPGKRNSTVRPEDTPKGK